MSVTITNAALAAGGRNKNIKAVLKNCAPFTNWISQIDNAKFIDVVMNANVQFNRI